MADVFISYAREDKSFVRKLHDALAKRDRSSWVDWSDIPLGTKWWEEVCRGIESADSFAFIISQNSLRSKYCMEELDHAVENNKRLAPISILQEDVAEKDMPRTLATHQYIEFREQENFEEAFEKLIKDLDTDIEWVHEHTRLLVRAKEWESKGRDSSMLLRGSELREAEEWQSRAADKEPKPTSLQSEYILASRRAASSRYRATIGAMGLAAVFFVVLGLVSLWQWREARSNAQEAQANALEARTQASIALSRLLLAQATELQNSQPDVSLLLNMEALRRAPATAREVREEARFSLLNKLTRPYHTSTPLTGHTDWVNDVAFSPDGELLASASDDGTVRLWDMATGKPHGEPLTGHTDSVYGVAFSPDGKLLATAGWDETVRLWDVATGKPRGEPLAGHTNWVLDVAFSPDSNLLASASEDSTVRLWDAATGKPRFVIGGAPEQHLPDQFESAFQYVTVEFEPAFSFEVGEDWEFAAAETTDQVYIWTGPKGGQLLFTNPTHVYDPRNPSEPKELAAPENAEEWLSWLQKHPNLNTSKPLPVSVGGESGIRVDVTASSTPENYPRKICGRQPCVPLYPAGGAGGISSAEDWKDRFIIVDVGGQTVVIDVAATAEKFDAFSPKAQEVLDSVEWKGG